MRVLVAGGGIGGIACGIALRAVGHEPIVLEQAPELGFVGQGIGLGANAIKALRFLGAADAVHQRAVPTKGWAYHSLQEGALQLEVPIGDRFGGEHYLSTHRADLLGALTARLTPTDLRLNGRIVDAGEDPNGVWVRLADGTTVDGDILVGADGVKSLVRDRFIGESVATFSRFVAWRAAVPKEFARPSAERHELRMFSGNAKFFVLYPIRDDLVNVSAYVPTDESEQESWTRHGDIEHLREVFKEGCDEVQVALSALETPLLTGIHVRDPLERWVTDRVALIGDAAHAMGPFSGNGGASAIEDAVTLALCLEGASTPDRASAALREYEQRRRPRMNHLQTDARARLSSLNDPDPAAPLIRAGIWAGMQRLDPLADLDFGWVYGHDPVVAARTPLEELALPGNVTRGRPAAQAAAEAWATAFTFHDLAEGWRSRRQGYERFLRQTFPPPAGLAVERTSLAGVPALVVGDPARGTEPAVVLHLHGGGFGMGSAEVSLDLVARLGDAAGAQVVVPDYRLAPEHPFPAAADDVLTVYRALCSADPGRNVIVTGEDAGGGLAIGLCQALRDAGEALPSAVFVVSPWLDLTVSSGSLTTTDPTRDPFLTRELATALAAGYVQSTDPALPAVSPLLGDLRGLPPVLVAAARDEALRDDAVALAAGTDRSTLVLVDDSVHSFVLFDLPETREVMDRFAALVRDTSARTGPTDG